MLLTKRQSLLLCLFLSIANLLVAQIADSPFMVPDTENNHFHRKCGIDQAIEWKQSQNPNYGLMIENFKRDIPAMLDAYRNNGERSMMGTIINVPVVVHVIHTGQPVGTGMNISDAQIQAQIEVLNEDFNALNDNFVETPTQWQSAIGNPEVNFCLAAIDPSGNPTIGITRHNMTVTGTNINNSNIESVIKPATFWNSNLYYNIWVLPIPGTTASGGTTGYAYYPFNGTIGDSDDGSVVDYNWFGGPGFGQSGDKTLTHETGHYLGLPHTFDDESCTMDDGFADTPNIDAGTSTYQPNLNCGPGNFPVGPSSCGNAHMYVNYMDYVNDDYCATSFTNDQNSLMRAVLDGQTNSFGYGSRLALANNAVSVCTFFDDDAGVTEILNPGTFMCQSGTITPQVVVTNFGQNNLNSVTINYQINNNAPVSLVWATNLATAEKDTVDLAPYAPPLGAYTLTTFTTLPNGAVDGQIENDSSAIQTIAINPLPLPLLEDFENTAFNPTINGLFTFDISNDGNVWERSTAASGFGNGSASVMFDNYNPPLPLGTIDALITPIYDFSSVSGAQVTFDVGYAIYDNGTDINTDTLIVLTSTDCGSNYTQQIFVKGGADLATGPPMSGQFTPNPTQWRTETIDLSAYDGEDNVSVMFVNYYGYGNRLFIDNINISLPCALTVTETHSDIDCFGECTGAASVNPSGGAGAYTYQWDANAGNATSQSVFNLCANTYSVTVSEGANCSEVLSITITENADLTAIVSGTNESAVAANDGIATATPSGGNNAVYTYLWSNAEITQTITGLAPGLYSVTVTDASGCTFVESITIAPYDCGAYGISVSGTNIICNSANDGTVTAQVNTGTGTAPFTYNWSNLAGNFSTITDLAAGEYFVTVTDDNGCSATGSYEVTEPIVLTVGVSTTDETSAGANDGTATATANGGTAPVTFSWSNAGNTAMISSLAPGTYTVTATDAQGCTQVAFGIVNTGAIDCSGFSVNVQSSNNSTCFQSCDGNITLTVNSTATPFTFDWNDNALDGTQNPINLCPGTYTVTVTDNEGCSGVTTQDITEPAPLIINWLASNVNCFGDCTGMIEYDGEGGTAPYTAVISGGSFTDLCAGFYDLVMTDAMGCSQMSTIEITEFGPDDITATVADANCFGSCDGSISVNAQNNGPYFFEWSNGGSNATETGLCAGTYNITVTNSQGCSTVITEIVGEPAELEISVSSTPITSAGADDATASVMVSGGSPMYQYLWQPNGELLPVIGPLAAGTYSVIVTDASGCTQTESIVINSFDCGNFSGTITATTDVSCFGESDGAITTSVNGGTMPITYLWSDPILNGQENPTGINAGDYTVTISEGTGCSTILNTTITEPNLLTLTVSGTNLSGPGANDGSAFALPSGGTQNYSYLWAPNGENTSIINNLPPGNYTVTVTDNNNCTAVENIVISDVDCSTLALAVTTTNVICFGEAQGTAGANPSGGIEPYSFSWSSGGMISSVNGLTAGIYDVLVTDGAGCTIQQSFQIQEPPVLDVTIVETDETSTGANDGTLTATFTTGGTPGYNYLWCNGSTSTIATNLPPGECGLTITDAIGCTLTVSGIIAPGGVDCSNFITTTQTIAATCFGTADGSATAVTFGGLMPITYQWSNGGDAATIINLEAGEYFVTVTDANNCQSILNAVITSPDELTANFTTTNETSPGAMDGTATATVSGGTMPYTYSWCNGETGSTATGLSEGICQLTITDGLGCGEVIEIVIGGTNVDCSNFLATLTTTGATCNGFEDGSAFTEVIGGTTPYTYAWSNGSDQSTINGLIPGLYTVTVTDANGCEAVETAMVTEPSQLTFVVALTAETSLGANDATGTVTPMGGTAPYTIAWCDGQTGETATNLASGFCELIVTDANGCSISEMLFFPPGSVDCNNFGAAISTEIVSCFGLSDGSATAITSGGAAPFTFNWSNGGNSPTITSLSAGNYFVTVVDANGCEVIENGIVAQPTEITYNITATNETAPGANDGSATAIVMGGNPPYTYVWCNGQTTATATGLPGGSCSVTIIDNIGCSQIGEVFIETTPSDCNGFSMIITTTDVSCFGSTDGGIIPQITGGASPITYNWSNGAISSTINNLPAGPYSLTVTDALGCELIDENIVVAQPLELVIQTTAYNGSCGGEAAAQATAFGGTSPYTYNWSNGMTGDFIDDLPAGVYQVTVTDNNGCINSQVVSVQVNTSAISIDTDVNAVSCFGDVDGDIDLTVTTGTAPYSFLWTNGATTEDLFNMPSGNYAVLISDAAGCLFGTTIIVGSPAPLSVNFITTPADNGSNGSATALVSGGTGPYMYNWNGQQNATITNLSTGSYAVTITDANGCTTEGSVLLGTSSTEDIKNLVSFNIFPNPTDGRFSIAAEFSESEEVTVVVYNVLGQRVFYQELSGPTLQLPIDIASQASGTYLVQLKTEKGSVVRKVVKN